MDVSTFLEPLLQNSWLVYFCYRPSDGHVLYVSPTYEQVFGGQAASINEELPAWLAALHPDDRPYLRENRASRARQSSLEVAVC